MCIERYLALPSAASVHHHTVLDTIHVTVHPMSGISPFRDCVMYAI